MEQSQYHGAVSILWGSLSTIGQSQYCRVVWVLWLVQLLKWLSTVEQSHYHGAV